MRNRTRVMNLDPLSQRELDVLGNYLLFESGSGQCMNLSMLDGYLTAVVCCPTSIPPTRWLKWVWDWECGEDAPEFESSSHGACILSLIVRHWNDIAGTLEHAPQHYVPLLLQEPKTKKPVIEEWCAGFMTGIRVSKRAWQSMVAAHPDDFSTMQMFGTDDGFETRNRRPPAPDEYEKRAYGIAEAVRMIYALRHPAQTLAETDRANVARKVADQQRATKTRSSPDQDDAAERHDRYHSVSRTLH